jgi:ABC-type sugar transport system permease subunit
MIAGRSRLTGLSFFGPAAVFFAVFLLAPLLAVVVISFTEWSGFSLSGIRMVGLENYQDLVRDQVFWGSLWHTLVFVALTTIGLNIVGFTLALLIHSRLRGHELLRVAILLPLGVSPVIAGLIWQQMLGPLGLANQVVRALGGAPIAFLGPGLAFATVIAVSIWMFTGYNTLLYYAGLQSLPTDRLDAAAVDGAGPLTTVRHIIVPYMRPVIAVVVVLNLIGGWKVFDIVYVLTRGGPSRLTEMLSTYLYEQAFTAGRVGYASALAVIVIVLATTSALLRGRISGEVEP